MYLLKLKDIEDVKQGVDSSVNSELKSSFDSPSIRIKLFLHL